MKELISPKAVESAMLWIAIAGPIVGLVIGAIAGIGRSLKARMLAGFAVGLLGPLILGFWALFGAITDSLGLDSVMNLLLQIVMFAIFGVLLGIAGFRISLTMRRLSTGK